MVVSPVCDFEEPESIAYATFGEWRVVGHGVKTNGKCGSFSKFVGCVRSDLHSFVSLDGVDHSRDVSVSVVRHSCGKPDCPVCYLRWAVREAKNIDWRLEQLALKFGSIEHVVASVPARDYGLDFDHLKLKLVKILKNRGVFGGVFIFHGFRYSVSRQWFWSPHFHVLGFVEGGAARCRGCCRDCVGCGGFFDRVGRFFDVDGWVVKLEGVRKSVIGTAYYQLNHAALRVGVRRFHVSCWFGVCGYRKEKIGKRPKDVRVCPICQHEMVKLRYSGLAHKGLYAAVLNPREHREESVKILQLEEVGLGEVWQEVSEGSPFS